MKYFLLSLLLSISFSNLNAQWVQQTSGTTQDLYSVSGTVEEAWICGNNGTILRSTNTGVTWVNAGSSLIGTLPLYNICSFGLGRAIVTGSNGTGSYVYKTINGGVNWTQVFFQAGGFINAIDIKEYPVSTTGYMQGDPVGGRWSLWKTTDQGSTWDSSGMYLPQDGSEAGWNNSLFYSGEGIFFGTNNGRIYYSNNGTNWTAQTTPEQNSYTVWINNIGDRGLSGGSQLMRTTTNGTNWFIQSAPGTGNIGAAIGTWVAFWFTRQGPDIYMSTDLGESWITDISVSGVQFFDMSIHLDAPIDNSSGLGLFDLWAVGSGGTIYYRDFAVRINNITTHTPERYSLSQNYPNPFNPTTKIKFDIVKSDFVSLKVFNSVGQEVSSLAEQNLQPGTYEVSFDGNGLSSGIYFYTLSTGDFKETKRMVLVK